VFRHPTFGSEFVAARIAVDQIVDHHTTLQYLGVPINAKSFFGDNHAVVTNSTIPHSCLSKRHNAFSYHRVKEAISGKVLNFFVIDGNDNPADVVSKNWAYPQVWHLLQPIHFSSGDASSLIKHVKE
jgi:hypothetical protein